MSNDGDRPKRGGYIPRPRLTKAKREERNRMFAAAMVALKFNATAAAISIGYPPESAPTHGHLLLKTPEVQALISEYVDRVIQRHDLSVDKLVTEAKHIAFSNIADFTRLGDGGERFIDMSETTREQLAAVAEITVDDVVEGREENRRTVRRTKVKFHDKLASIQMLMRFFTNGGKVPGDAATNVDNSVHLTQVNISAQQAGDEYRKMIGEG